MIRHDWASIGKKDGGSGQLLDMEKEGLSPLDMFIMLRSGTLSPEIARNSESGIQRKVDKGISLYICAWFVVTSYFICTCIQSHHCLVSCNTFHSEGTSVAD